MRFAIDQLRVYDPVLPLSAAARPQSERRIVDLCSGGAGLGTLFWARRWPLPSVNPCQVVLTDRSIPTCRRLPRSRTAAPPDHRGSLPAIDATCVPADLVGSARCSRRFTTSATAGATDPADALVASRTRLSAFRVHRKRSLPACLAC